MCLYLYMDICVYISVCIHLYLYICVYEYPLTQVVRGRCKREECNTLMDLLISHAARPKVFLECPLRRKRGRDRGLTPPGFVPEIQCLLRGMYPNPKHSLLQREVTDHDGICAWLLGSF